MLVWGAIVRSMEAQGRGIARTKSVWDRLPLWLVPLVILVVLSMALSFLVYRVSGGREIADDVKVLARFVREPFVLWGNYGAAGLSGTWGSFPPLLPLVFGALVRPWLMGLPDFWGFRLGVLTWSVVVLLALHLVVRRQHDVSRGRKRFVLVVFALLPSVLGAISWIPQEEIYVSLYCLALYAAAARGRWNLVFALLVLSVLAGKYFLLVLAVPLALQSRSWARNLALWGGTSLVLLAAYVSYHRVLYGLTPILSHAIEPGWAVSVWALIWNLGFTSDPRTIEALSLGTITVAVFAFCIAGRRSGIPLVFLMAGTLYVTLIALSIATPAYVLWNVPLVLLCIGFMRVRRHVAWTVVLLFLWGAGEWGANFFRGVKLALDTTRPEGKVALARLAERFLGPDFPYHAFQVACIALVVASGLVQIRILWAAGRDRRLPETDG